jgi:acyl phosphate:glycerol-3-phosphate acyltransferase
MIDTVIAIIIGYIFGSIPSAYLAGRLRKGIDIREVGSKNMGAMNVYYEVGLAEAVVVTLVDLGKGVGAILLVRWLLNLPLISPFDLLTALTGLAALAGHIFPVFLKFRGGKGAATAIGVLLFLMPLAFPILLVVFAVALSVTRNPTFSYSLLLIVFPFIAWLIYFDRHGEPLIFFSIGIGVFLGIQYVPRLKEMHSKTGGDWHKVIKRRSLKDRF